MPGSFPKLPHTFADNTLYSVFPPTAAVLQGTRLHMLNVHFQGLTFIMARNTLISLQRAVKNHNNADSRRKQGDPLVPLSVLFNFPQVWNLENRFAYKYLTQFSFR